MKQGYLSQYFDGVAIKQLSAVEADIITSNQHEFNGVEPLKTILGEPVGKVRYSVQFIYLSDDEDVPVVADGFLTWYDARERARRERNVMRWEYRLYFPTNDVTERSKAGDILVIAKRPGDSMLAIVAEEGSTIAGQILWLFGVPDGPQSGFIVYEDLEEERDRVEFTSRFILESIGIAVEVSEENWIEILLREFVDGFPTTKEFSRFARSTLPEVVSESDHDAALMAWMEREEVLFRVMEKHLISERLSQGFNDDVDAFLKFSLSVQNRRKSRAGLALENHLELLFQECRIRYSRTPTTENSSKPDFIFPGKAEYHDRQFDSLNLTMLGVKTSCKDRWRQILAEADRIASKHLLTLEPAISERQTDEMEAKNVQLVLPKSLHSTFSAKQQCQILSVSQFTELVRSKQINS